MVVGNPATTNGESCGRDLSPAGVPQVKYFSSRGRLRVEGAVPERSGLSGLATEPNLSAAVCRRHGKAAVTRSAAALLEHTGGSTTLRRSVDMLLRMMKVD